MASFKTKIKANKSVPEQVQSPLALSLPTPTPLTPHPRQVVKISASFVSICVPKLKFLEIITKKTPN